MDKLLLTLTLLAFSSGVLCNVAHNLTEDVLTADSVLPGIKVLSSHEEFYNGENKCCTNNVPKDYRFIRDKEAYKLNKTKVNWNQARKFCMDEGGLLAILTADADAAKLVYWMKQENVWDAWIGTHDMFEPGHWVTLTGESLTSAGYDHWLLGEPDNAGGHENCGTLGAENGMNDLTCTWPRAFICKMIKC